MWFRRLSGSPLCKVLFWLAVLFALVMALLPHPPEVPGEPSDKIQHIAAFAILAGLGALAYPAVRRINLFACLSLFGAAIEVLQATPALHRDSDPIDWLADTVACGVVLLVVGVLLRTRR
jgi:VanZ family protein